MPTPTTTPTSEHSDKLFKITTGRIGSHSRGHGQGFGFLKDEIVTGAELEAEGATVAELLRLKHIAEVTEAVTTSEAQETLSELDRVREENTALRMALAEARATPAKTK